jgi:hypothetical protein
LDEWKIIVHDLRILRENWNAVQKEETLLLRATPIQESILQWLHLQSAFEWQLQQTASLFEQDRWKALAELQARLRLLAD